jgi:phosphatidylserine/phosphatidylglycerophosphate/cardiolipin synthase-like enzyme
LNVNSASVAQLEALHGVGAAIAERIVDERLSNGVFRSFKEFDDRVKGIGANLARTLHNALSFATPDEEWLALPYDATHLAASLGILISITRQPDERSRLLRALEIIASTCAVSPHPAVREKRIRDDLRHDATLHATDAVTVLASTAYYEALIDRINAATTSIAVCMFHIALASRTHPTRRLLDALIGARNRSVSVRVLVDLDKKTDPYRSAIINRPALDYLARNGVRCRSDDRERLLHSKFLVIDKADVIIGSHNWSAGSYFQFDDASVMVTSSSYAALMSQRFDDLWELTPPDHVAPD